MARGYRVANGIDLEGSDIVVAILWNPSSWASLEVAEAGILANKGKAIAALSAIASSKARAESAADDWYSAEGHFRGVCLAFDEICDTQWVREGALTLWAAVWDG